jgi:hypothetical protein
MAAMPRRTLLSLIGLAPLALPASLLSAAAPTVCKIEISGWDVVADRADPDGWRSRLDDRATFQKLSDALGNSASPQPSVAEQMAEHNIFEPAS